MKRVLVICLSLLLAAGGFMGLRTANRAERDAAVNQTQASAWEIVVLHNNAAALLFEEMNMTVLEAVGEGTAEQTTQASEDRRTGIAALQQRLAVMEATMDVNKLDMSELQDMLADDADLNPPVTNLYDQWDMALSHLNASNQVARLYPEMASYATLADIALSPHIMFNRGLDVAIAESDAQVAGNLAEYFEAAVPYLEDEYTELGPTPNTPLPQWVDPAYDYYPDEATKIGEGLVSSGLYGYDQWLGTWVSNPGSAPMTINEIRQVTTDQLQAFGQLTQPISDEKISTFSQEADDAQGRISLWRLVGMALFASAALVAIWLVVGAVRSRNELAKDSLTDPLTGLGNRRYLDTVTKTNLAKQQYNHHLVGVVDMDGLKMINDSFGHGVGDSALVAVAQRMTTMVDAWQAGPGTRLGSVIRMGGDEFLFILHSDQDIDSDRITRALRDEVERPLPADGDAGAGAGEIAIRVSVGVAPCNDAEDLSSATTKADLAAYDDKKAEGKEHLRRSSAVG